MDSQSRAKGRKKAAAAAGQPLDIRLLGQMAVRRGGKALAFPASRKVRALFAYLALAPNAMTRSQLCDLLWDVASDPRGELRWCLSKIRGFVDDKGRKRVETAGETVRFDLSDCFVDVIEVGRAIQNGIDALAREKARELADLFAGDLLEGLEIDRNPAFETWLVSERRRFRDIHAALLERLARDPSDAAARIYVDRWVRLAPFDIRPHEVLLTALASQGQVREGDEHLGATEKLFTADGLDPKPLREMWRTLRARSDRPAPVRVLAVEEPSPALIEIDKSLIDGRASVAVMPFTDMSALAVPGGPADALVHDVITRLAKLRSLRIIAQGTVFALGDQRSTPDELGRILGVDYVVTGALRRSGSRFVVSVEIAETRSSRIVWAEVLQHSTDDTFLLLEELGNRIVASIDREIETAERNRAVLKPPSSLDAWEAHHRGLWHVYRFTKPDNDQAQHFFQLALARDPTFARAHAGLSFTHFQNAFLGWEDRDIETARAYAAASESLMADDRDPAAHWAMGRALWLRGRLDQSIGELESSVDLSPNFALGHYMLAFVQSQQGDASAAITAADHSRTLSPFDPMLFGIFASRALALARLGRYDEAADWGAKAALRPNVHAHAMAVGALCMSLAGRTEEARKLLASIHATEGYAFKDFLSAFQLSADDAATFREAATRIGLR